MKQKQPPRHIGGASNQNSNTMKIKITGRDPERFNENLKLVLNAACVMAMGGYIPSPIEMSTPEQRGKYWFIENNTDAE